MLIRLFVLAATFGIEAQFWSNLQPQYNLLQAKLGLKERLEAEVTPYAA